MVALLVLLTILAFLVMDGVVLSYNARKAQIAPQLDTGLVFAQDGGKPVEDDKSKPQG